ncbi:hypothetical protein [Nocardia pseudobrasiliensis]|uniref:Uncharacterized protein n=1 Tax=Nocardia pseudobrasiliensis TaxID=45979 RepID=A0A370IFG8_9NOCA|nr:hypothetical protein [Nocardia pseudobrasiliensis]RDI69433.1 hypothetical protein DFR76_101974 [Nocardia pseudobrasiliensis]
MTTDTNLLSSFHVRWSAAESAFVARSDRYPGLTCRDEYSSLAAVDGLLVLIERQRCSQATRRPAA